LLFLLSLMGFGLLAIILRKLTPHIPILRQTYDLSLTPTTFCLSICLRSHLTVCARDTINKSTKTSFSHLQRRQSTPTILEMGSYRLPDGFRFVYRCFLSVPCNHHWYVVKHSYSLSHLTLTCITLRHSCYLACASGQVSCAH